MLRMVNKSKNLDKSKKFSKIHFYSKNLKFFKIFFFVKKEEEERNAILLIFQEDGFDPSSPVQPASESRGGSTSVTDGAGRRKSSCLIQENSILDCTDFHSAKHFILRNSPKLQNTTAESRQLCCPFLLRGAKYYLQRRALYNVYCALFTVQCTLCTVHCTLYSVHCTVYTTVCVLYECTE